MLFFYFYKALFSVLFCLLVYLHILFNIKGGVMLITISEEEYKELMQMKNNYGLLLDAVGRSNKALPRSFQINLEKLLKKTAEIRE